ncbi:cell wall hydrolase [Paenibacillus agricola]|uniref:Spore cortex-lytic protein n=1 Tax=Paenibacillus agricola TaxID=2716264 RepID=A0ABX0JGD2_9BACL|nr:cell wall hydrolase [Paenibacillus agricola]NHN33748.1 spore cortex-lytic protein [Paenibacillus agricola]
MRKPAAKIATLLTVIISFFLVVPAEHADQRMIVANKQAISEVSLPSSTFIQKESGNQVDNSLKDRKLILEKVEKVTILSAEPITEVPIVPNPNVEASNPPKLETPSLSSTTEKKSISDSDKELLARLVTAEARNQPYLGQVAVAAVVLNRTESDKFPETIEGVINANNGKVYQFSPVKNGSINKPAIEAAVQAVEDALNGSDPTNGSLYFAELKSAAHVPNRNANVTVKIGDHTFYK